MEYKYKEEKLVIEDIPEALKRPLMTELLDFYAYNHFNCPMTGITVCGYCCSHYHKRTRVDLQSVLQKKKLIMK